jgi:hypothetical protein
MPTDELENELRGTFARAAADFENPDQVRQRLLQRNYHPRGRNRLLAAGIIATAVAAVVLGAGLSGVFRSASHQPRHSAHAQLAAWTVVKQADGNVTVTLRQLRDPAGLQSKLRAEGVPASVTFGGHQNPACRPYPASAALLNMVFLRPLAPAQPNRKLPHGHRLPPPDQRAAAVLVIHPSALPTGTGVQLAANESSRQRHQGPILPPSTWCMPARSAPVPAEPPGR